MGLGSQFHMGLFVLESYKDQLGLKGSCSNGLCLFRIFIGLEFMSLLFGFDICGGFDFFGFM